MVIAMTTNLFPLPYWAPAFQRVPLFLSHEGETCADRLRHDHGRAYIPISEQKTCLNPSPEMFRKSSPTLASASRSRL